MKANETSQKGLGAASAPGDRPQFAKLLHPKERRLHTHNLYIMSDVPLAMGILGAMMERIMKNLAKLGEVKELSSALSGIMDEVTASVDSVAVRLESVEDDMNKF